MGLVDADPIRTTPASAGSSLSERAARALSQGPLDSGELASRVLRLKGPETVAARMVETLLEGDPRFRKKADGRWALADPGGKWSEDLRRTEFAVVDVETTGSSYRRGHRITEVAVVLVKDGVVSDRFETLVNPGRRVPSGIQSLTGITDEMVARAPYFDVVAEEVYRFLQGRIFVAHNAPFDRGFLEAELAQALGDVPEMVPLCTVRLARSLIPRLGRYHLDQVTSHLGIPVDGRHRAGGDAYATARVLLQLLDRAALKGVRDVESLLALARGGGRRGSRRHHFRR